MRTARVLVLVLLLSLIAAACAPAAAPAPAPQAPAPSAATPTPAKAPQAAPATAAWQARWDSTLTAAKKEGTVVITINLSADAVAAMEKAFKEAYGIPVESIAARTAEVVTKVLAERRAGIYSYDVYISGSTSWINNLKGGGAADRLDPALITPDVTDPEIIKQVWFGGALPWVDADHTNLAPTQIVVFSTARNTNLVKDGEIKSYRDLLDPKWQGKLASDDPTVAGIGANVFAFMQNAMGDDFLAELAKAKPTLLRDQRQAMDWLAQGKIALLLGPRIDLLPEYIKLGAPVKGIIPTEGTFLTGGACNISLYNKAPHPNAATTLINWYLSKEGQSVVAPAAGYQSGRTDVSAAYLPPEQLRQAGVKYFTTEDEKYVVGAPARLKKFQELLAPLTK